MMEEVRFPYCMWKYTKYGNVFSGEENTHIYYLIPYSHYAFVIGKGNTIIILSLQI